MKRILYRGLLALYLVMLIWLVLFKFSFDIFSVFDYHHRSLNLIPFAVPSMVNGSFRDMIDNVIIFIPFGLLLSVNFKNIRFLTKLAFIMLFSISVECIQFIFAIGATDITDLLTNTIGGLLGLALYGFSNHYIDHKKLDGFIIIVGSLLLVLILYYRIFFIKIRY